MPDSLTRWERIALCLRERRPRSDASRARAKERSYDAAHEALLGVHSDRDREVIQKAVAEERLAWGSFKRVRGEAIRPEDLDEVIVVLVAKAEG